MMAPPHALRLRNGSYFDLAALDASGVTIETIAHALALQCRFNGHCPLFYSVAEHSIHTSFLVPPEHALAALMHDAAEAIVGDLPSPLKRMLPDYRAIEERVHAALAARFGLPATVPAAVLAADHAMLIAEKRAMFLGKTMWTEAEADEPPRDVKIMFWRPHEAKPEFITRYRALGGRE